MIQNRSLFIVLMSTAVILLIPLIAMQLSNEVNWELSDFVVAAILLIGTGLVLSIIIRKVKNIKYRITIAVVLLIVLLLIWAEMAVGIFGTPLSGS